MSKSIEVETKTFVRFWLVILAFVAAGFFIFKAMTGIIIVLIAVFFAVALRPLARQLDRIDKSKERRSLSSVGAVVIVVLALAAVIGFVGPVIFNETSKFISSVPEQINSILNNDSINKFGNQFGVPNLREQIISGVKESSQAFVKDLSNLTINSIGTIGSTLTGIILVIVLTILFMLQGPDLMNKLWSITEGKDKEASKVWRRVIDRMASVIAKYASGQLLVAILDGVVVGFSILIFSLCFGFSTSLAIPLGLIAAFFYLIPMFGPIITSVLVTLLLLPSSLWAAITFLVFYIIYAQIENNVISPKIQGKGMALPPLVILISVTIGIYTLGLIGCVVAIPIAGCIKVLVEEYPNIKKVVEEN